ncbi:MAG: glycosyltransferase, partial [Chloroflexota bacterium]
RNFHLNKVLAQTHEVWLNTFLEAEQPSDHGPLHTLCQGVETTPVPVRSTQLRLKQMLTTTKPDMAWRLWSEPFVQTLRQTLKNVIFDVVHVEGIEMAPYVPTIRRFAPQAKIVYDDHNAEWLLQARNFQVDLKNPSRWVAALYSFVQTQRLKAYERWVSQTADRVVVCSQADQLALKQLDSTLDIAIIPNGVDLPSYRTYDGPIETFDLVFTGKMDYRPNIDAMLWFGQEVFPKILAQRPSTTFAIVGQKPHVRLDPLRKNPAITITGFVDEVMPYIYGAKVFVAPFRIGGGTRLKLLEAMAMQKPIVATTVGAEGYPIRAGTEMMIADDQDQMAQVIVSLLDDSTERERLGKSAFEFVEAHYSWGKIVPLFEPLYQ